MSTPTASPTCWPDGRPDSARNALQVKVSRLRSLLGPHAARLEHRHGAYRLALDPCETDAGEFTALVAQARLAQEQARPGDAVPLLRDAVTRWRGDPLPDLRGFPRITASTERLHEMCLAAREDLAEALIASPATLGEAVAELRALLGEEPFRPRARLLLMQALDASGRRADALAVDDTGRRLLAESRGMDPPAEMRSAFAAMLAAERASARRSADRAVPTGRSAPRNLLQRHTGWPTRATSKERSGSR